MASSNRVASGRTTGVSTRRRCTCCAAPERLRRELALDWAGVAVALDLLGEVERLRLENRHLRRRLGRFAED